MRTILIPSTLKYTQVLWYRKLFNLSWWCFMFSGTEPFEKSPVWRTINEGLFFFFHLHSEAVVWEENCGRVKWRVTLYYCWSCHAMTNGELKQKRFFLVCVTLSLSNQCKILLRSKPSSFLKLCYLY